MVSIVSPGATRPLVSVSGKRCGAAGVCAAADVNTVDSVAAEKTIERKVLIDMSSLITMWLQQLAGGRRKSTPAG